jgi:hypothetical protein
MDEELSPLTLEMLTGIKVIEGDSNSSGRNVDLIAMKDPAGNSRNDSIK